MKIGTAWRLPNSVKSYYNDSYNVMQAREQFMDVFIALDLEVAERAFLDNQEKGQCGL